MRFPVEIKERLYAAGLNAAEVARLTLEELERREAENNAPSDSNIDDDLSLEN